MLPDVGTEWVGDTASVEGGLPRHLDWGGKTETYKLWEEGASWNAKAGLGINAPGRNGLWIWIFLNPRMAHSFKEIFLRSDIHWALRKQVNADI